jgi:hypothetical protein
MPVSMTCSANVTLQRHSGVAWPRTIERSDRIYLPKPKALNCDLTEIMAQACSIFVNEHSFLLTYEQGRFICPSPLSPIAVLINSKLVSLAAFP